MGCEAAMVVAAADVSSWGMGARVVVAWMEGAAAEIVIVSVSVVVTGFAVAVVVLVSTSVVVWMEEMQSRPAGIRPGGDTVSIAGVRDGVVDADAMGRREGAALAGSTPSATSMPLIMVSVDCSYAARRSSISRICSIDTVLIPADCLWNMLECLLGHTYFARSPRSGSVTCIKSPL